MTIVGDFGVSRSTESEQPASHAPDESTSDFDPRPPRWVDEILGAHPSTIDLGPDVRAIASGPLVMVTTTIALATDMPAPTLRTEVARAYRRIEHALSSMDREPIRFWNYIPAIDGEMGNGLNRYMVFNSGRHDVFAPGGRDGEPSERPIATASAVGVSGSDLIVYCLASDRPGSAVENPRQTSPWRYSARYGPVPPCFSRATITTLGRRTVLLIGGTASIVGERSLHPNNAEAQLRETLRNIGALVGAARKQSEEETSALERLVDLRVYAINDDVAGFVQRELAGRCPNAERTEIVRARICRPELLLEIEGVAEI